MSDVDTIQLWNRLQDSLMRNLNLELTISYNSDIGSWMFNLKSNNEIYTPTNILFRTDSIKEIQAFVYGYDQKIIETLWRNKMIEKCECKNEYQDEVYGKGNRVYNPCKKEDMYRCTVCQKEKFIQIKKDKK